jgi:hypothetical protein
VIKVINWDLINCSTFQPMVYRWPAVGFQSPPILAALAQPMNSTEQQVLQRLFSLADVNSKAS